jgi:hypothetical protein
MATAFVKSQRLIDGASATGVGAIYDVEGYRGFTFTTISTGVTTGATIKVQATDFEDNVVSIISFTANATGNLANNWYGPLKTVKGNITAYTDGTHTLRFDAGMSPRR